MKRIILSTTLGLITSVSFSQEIRTLFSNDSTKTISYGGYGAPLIQAAQTNDKWGILLGGKGGVIINRKIAFGGIGIKLTGNNTFLGNNLSGDTDAQLNLSYGAGGVFFEYIFKMESPIHFSIPINIMGGRVSVNKTASTNTRVESSTMFIIEPGINLEFNLFKYFTPAISLSYKHVSGISLKNNISAQDISGINIGVILKFGYF